VAALPHRTLGSGISDFTPMVPLSKISLNGN
jgi:hypothetical protein